LEPVLQKQEPVETLENLSRWLVNGAYDSHAMFYGVSFELFHYFEGGVAIQSTRRLVTQEQIGISYELVSNACSLSFTARDSFDEESADTGVSASFKTQSLDNIFNFLSYRLF